MRKIRTIIALFCIFCLLFSFGGCKSSQSKPHEKTLFSYFDTVSIIYGFANDSDEEFTENCREIESILAKYHRLFDIYNEYDGINNLCTVNKYAGGEPVAVDRELIDFLLYAKELYNTTKGEMNIMMGSVLSLWHEAREKGSLPDESALSRMSRFTSIELLEIDEKNNTVRISQPFASLDVGAVGKGYATEKAAEHLESKGVSSYVLDIGGNIRLIGSKPDGGGWVTGIKDPHNTSGYAERLLLGDTSCVTSGDYERFFEQDGVRYHHIIDKDTLYPSTHFSSVTVICDDSGLADALSTALFCMSLEEGQKLVFSLGNVDVIWVTPSGDKHVTAGIYGMRAK